MADPRLQLERLSPQQLQELIEKLRPKPSAQRAAIPRRPPGETRLPLTFAQERLWLLDRLEPGAATYNMACSIDLAGELHVAALAAALAHVARRHEALRTTFELGDGVPFQRVGEPGPVALPVIDLSRLDEAARRAEAQALAVRIQGLPFDLARGPLLRAVLLALAADRHLWVLALHHIVADGWSIGVLFTELTRLYEAAVTSAPAALPALPIQVPDFALWQRRRGTAGLAELEYWRERLAPPLQPSDLPSDRRRPAVQSFRGAREVRVLAGELADRIRALGLRHGATLFMTLLAAVKVLLSRHSGQTDVLVGTPVAGRTQLETEPLIGIFLNNLVVRTDLGGDPSFAQVLARVREATLGAFSHQEVPFEALVGELLPERDLSRTPFFQVFFNLLNFPQAEAKVHGLTLTAHPPAEVPAKFDLTFYVEELADCIRVDLVYNADLFAAARVEDFLAQLELVLSAAVERPEAAVAGVSLLSEAARGVLPDPAAPLDGSWVGAVHERFARQARLHPGRTAVADPTESWTYAELDDAAARLAGWLRAHGVERGERVALYAHRSAPLALGVLAALKAGGAFALLDPAYPAPRLVEMLDLAAPRALLILAAAGPLPEAVAAWCAAAGCPRRVLPEGGPAAVRESLAGLLPAPALPVGADDLACMGFTSGSTGSPKAILGRHGPLSHFLPWQCERFGLVASDRFSMLSGLAHDPLQRDLFTPFFLGATLVAPDPLDLGVAGRLASWMARERVSVAHLTPAMAQILTERPADGRDLAVPTLRRVFLVGDALTRRDVARIRRLAPGAVVVNLYGSTETQRAVGFHVAEEAVEDDAKQVLPLGRGMQDAQLLVLNRAGALAGIGELGEIALRSPHLARGYWRDPALTAERFVAHPLGGQAGERIYRTGDLGRYLPDGEVVFAGRADAQVKIRGFRVEPAEVEAAICGLAGVREAAVVALEQGGEKSLLAAVVAERPGAVAVAELREALRRRLPSYMVPAACVLLDQLPLTSNGKVDRRAVARLAPAPDEAVAAATPLSGELERAIAAVWCEVLELAEVDPTANFFDVGGHSLRVVRLQARLTEALGRDVPLMVLFAHPTVRAQAAHLAAPAPEAAARPAAERPRAADERIAVVGMAGRFPRAAGVEQLWQSLRDGLDAITYFSADELTGAGVAPELVADPSYVKARGVLADADLFDADFFGYSPRQAELMDPQLRVFLETAWEALEDAGCDPEQHGGAIGVYGGATLSTYLLHHLLPDPGAIEDAGAYQVLIATDRDFLTTQVSYKLGLRGPSLSLQTACSTSLVAVHVACRALLSGECDVALAGGVSIKLPQVAGYRYQEGGLDSSDGRCRSFDARADGSVYGSGAGVVVLKRLADAVAQGDTIRAVILGSAINNDGAGKVGYTAPSVAGQAQVIRAALDAAGVEPATLGYVECHGSATSLGDPIEVTALAEALGRGEREAPCRIGSVKSNLGHLGAAAGIAGLIKTVLALEHREIPPSLHFETPNPRLNLEATPLVVNDRLTPWRPLGGNRRAGVSSFGLGGTNAHLILEEAPAAEAGTAARPFHLFVLSARSAAALERATDNLAGFLARPDLAAPDVAHTLQVGRKAFAWRRAWVARDLDEARQLLAARDPRRLVSGQAPSQGAAVAFLLPGVGDHYAGMARGLYESEPVFRSELDRCLGGLDRRLGLDLRSVLLAGERPRGGGLDLRRLAGRAPAASGLERTLLAQPAVFAVEWALARLLASWGVEPRALLGYSLGEFVAAALAGVFSLDDALLLVAERARLIDGLPPGAMLAVALPAERLAERLGGDLDVAAENGPELSVVAGAVAAVEELAGRLAAEGVTCRRLPTSHAFHSRQMAPVAAALRELAAGIRLSPPRIPVLSNLTGTWLSAEEATDPGYWSRHLLGRVCFAAGLDELWREPSRVLLEVGPGNALSALAVQSPRSGGRTAVPTLPHAADGTDDRAFLLDSLGRLFVAGVRFDGRSLAAGERRRRVALPTYPFERSRFWIEPGGARKPVVAAPPPARIPGALAERAAPREEVIAALMSGLLGRAVGRHDSFFALGGHSLMATRLLTRLRDELGAELTLAELFTAPTPASLAAVAGERRLPPVPIARLDRSRALPLSFGQERLWVLDRLEPGSPAYNIPAAWRLSGRLDAAALGAALSEVVRRHESLRTTFPDRAGRPEARIAAPRPLHLPLVDLGALPSHAAEREALRLATAEAASAFDLAAGPLLRALLLRFAAAEHWLLVTLHHMIADGWSLGVLVRELGLFYAAAGGGRPSPVAELPVQYVDFAAWQRERLSGELLAGELAHWRERLAAAAVLDLPADRARPPLESLRGARQRLAIEAPLVARLAARANERGATLFMLLLAAFKALLSRLTGAEDVAVGTPVAGRTHRDVEELIGLFLNTLVLRTDLSGDPPFAELVGRVRGTALAAFDHQELPFERLVEELQPRRDLARSPLFTVLFILQNAPAEAVTVEGLTLEAAPEVFHGASRFDLTVSLTEVPTCGLVGYLEYKPDLWDAATAERWAGWLAGVLGAAAEEPGLRLSALPVLDGAESRQVLAALNDTERELSEAPVSRLIERQAARTPDAVAVSAAGETLTYRELNRRANRLARRLCAAGAAPETVVGIALERSAALPVAALAVLKSGAAYLPLDPAYPADRLRFMMADSGMRLLLSEPRTAAALPEHGARMLLADGREPADGPGEDLDLSPLPAGLAYVLYTSGSTGRPKGVMVAHRALTNFLCAMQSLLEPGPADVLLAVTSLSFDIAALELYLPLMTGGRLEVASGEEAGEGRGLLRRLDASAATILQATPATWQMLLGAGWPGSPRLRAALCGGEALGGELARELAARVPRVWNVYGPTETTVWSTAGRVAGAASGNAAIGSPLANTRIYVTDRRTALLPAGIPGELLIGGLGVARGYLGRPEQTAERFVPDPFGGGAGSRLYRTGDRVRLRPDGTLEFLGRLDNQIKIRGFRVELGEVEAVLQRHPEVEQAVAVASGERLVAHYVARRGAAPAGLRAHLAAALPAYMVPAAIVEHAALPLTPNGKVDRLALSRMGAPEAAAFAAPQGETETLLAALWADLLGLPRVGRDDDFFISGGHSILATVLLHRVRESFGVDLPLRALFAAPTLAGLAEAVAAARPAPAGEPAEQDAPESYRLSPIQQGILFHALAAGEAAPYFEQIVLPLPAGLEVDRLAACWQRLVDRHPVLRTSFHWEDLEEPVQKVERRVTVPLAQLDWRDAAPQEREARLAELLAADRARGFELTRAPLLRLTVVRWDGDSVRILWTYHHLLLDGASLGLLIAELSELYAAASGGRAASLAERRPYRDYIAWLGRQDRAAAQRYWRAELGDFASPTVLAMDLAAAGEVTVPSGHETAEARLDTRQTAALADFARERGLTLYTVVEAAFALTLSRLSGQAEVVFGTTVSGRPVSLPGAEAMIGCFINTLPVRVRLDLGRGIADWLRELQTGRAEMRAFEHTPLVEIRACSAVPANRPLFDAILVFESFAAAEAPAGWLSDGRTNFAMTLVVWPRRELTLRACTYRNRFRRADVERFLALLAAILTALPETDGTLSRLPLLVPGEAVAASRAEPAVSRCLHEIFAEQAARRPQAVALVCGAERLTYRELDRRANRLAHRLRGLGVGPETVVGLLTERSLETVVGLLGILKAGGAYLPLDPAYPEARRRLMLEDAGVSLVVGQSGLAVPADGGEEGPDDAPPSPAVPGNLAYVIYTSGSTGRPKGVPVPHDRVVRLFAATQETFGFGPDDVWTLFHSPAFDFSVWEIWGALLYGGRLVVVPYWVSRSPEELHRLLAAEAVTVLNQTPSAFRQLIAADAAPEAGALALRWVIFGGEALEPTSLRPWLERHGDAAPRLVNMYGITETTVHVTLRPLTMADALEPASRIGRPIADLSLHIADRDGWELPHGVPGEILVGGAGLARGYLGRPELTAERFVPDPWSAAAGERLYRSGDLARRLPDGELEYLGRIDQQIKVRGFRIEPGEIEAALREHPAVRDAAVLVRGEGEARELVAYLVAAPGAPAAQELRSHLAKRLPDYMVPSAFVVVEELPLTPHGKLDRDALPAPGTDGPAEAGAAPSGALEAAVARVFEEVLGVAKVGRRSNFFDLGGHSLKLVTAAGKLRQALGRPVAVVDLFHHPTVESLAAFLAGDGIQQAPPPAPAAAPQGNDGFAVVGMAGRFPGAEDLDALWANLAAGVESIVTLSDEALLSAGVPPEVSAAEGYVRACPVLAGIDRFDAPLFGFSPRDAELLDPQQRLFLECAWHALEHAGYDPRGTTVPVGVYAGAQLSTYAFNLLANPEVIRAVGGVALMAAVDKDFLATRVSYALNLKGPSLAVQTACSTSLVAVHLACQALRLGECDMALAGGVTVRVPQAGYTYQEAGIQSPDGHCRAFDAAARGTVFGSGVGVVVLKRLADALRDGDTVHAAVKGSAVNNDGSVKVGFTAPGVEGQAQVIAAAHAAAGVSADSITYVEAHGTATPLGDPVEVAALTRAFRRAGDRRGYCALGTIKSNVGHLDAAAGVAGLIKTVLALKHRQIPPSLHFVEPNPKIDFAASPFAVNARLRDWPADEGPRRAGVSSFGIGGTNAHVVLEEAPPAPAQNPFRGHQLLVVSARTEEGLEAATDGLAAWLGSHPEASLPDAAYTLAAGRHRFAHRRFVVAAGAGEAAAALAARDPALVRGRLDEHHRRRVAFLLPGQGAQHRGMGVELYRGEEAFRREVDACREAVGMRLGADLREVLAAGELDETRLAQPALFVTELALARLFIAWGVEPWALLGHSLGEIVAACLAGVMTREDALALVCLRGELMQALPRGAMLAVELSQEALAERLAAQPSLALAAVNAPGAAVLSGPLAEIEACEALLAGQGAACRRLRTSHAFHSAMMDPVVEPLSAFVSRLALAPPAVPFVSNLTGTWITAAEATDPAYWARQLRAPVRFADGIEALRAADPEAVLLEVGPGRALGELARRADRSAEAVAALGRQKDARPETLRLLEAVGELWLRGVGTDAAAFHGARRRLPLPLYPFERRRYWIDAVPRPAADAPPERVPTGHARPELPADWAAPRDETERLLLALWESLLGISGLGIHDDFFALGGHSLLATRVISRVRQELGGEPTLEDLFEAPTVAGFAARLAIAPTGAFDTPPIVPLPRTGPLPLSFAQQRLVFLDVLDEGDVAYNLPLGLRLRGRLSLPALGAAFEDLVSRHETLRTTFDIAGGDATQRIAARAPEELSCLALVDLAGLQGERAERAAERLAAEEAGRKLDLWAGPVVRARLLALGRDDHVLVIVVHHVAADGWSWGVFLRDLVELYQARLEGRPARLPALPIQYADFAGWQRAWLAGGELERQLAFWKKQLAALPRCEVAPDHPRPPVRSGRGGVTTEILPPDAVAALNRLAREENATLFMVLLAGFLVLLHADTAQDDLVVGTDVANRNRAETEELVGLFVNQLVLRADLSGNPTFSELLGRVRRITREAYAHQDAPFDKVVEALNPPRDVSRTPLFSVKLVLQNTPLAAEPAPGLYAGLFGIHNGTAKFDLLLNLTEGAEGLFAALEYNTDLYAPASMARLLARFAAVAGEAAQRPEATVEELAASLRQGERAARERRAERALAQVRRKAIAVTP